MAAGYTDLILTRDLQTSPTPPQSAEGFQCLAVQSTDDTGFIPLDQFCSSNGFPNRWANSMLQAGHRAWVVVAQDNSKHEEVVAAMAWTLSAPFFVDEIGRTFDPGTGGVYFFGDFVGKTWRGRRLHQLLIRERVNWAVSMGARFAHAITRDNNEVSVRNYITEGFAIAASIGVRFLGPLRFDHYKCPRAALPAGSISPRGMWLPFGWRMSRRKKH